MPLCGWLVRVGAHSNFQSTGLPSTLARHVLHACAGTVLTIVPHPYQSLPFWTHNMPYSAPIETAASGLWAYAHKHAKALGTSYLELLCRHVDVKRVLPCNEAVLCTTPTGYLHNKWHVAHVPYTNALLVQPDMLSHQTQNAHPDANVRVAGPSCAKHTANTLLATFPRAALLRSASTSRTTNTGHRCPDMPEAWSLPSASNRLIIISYTATHMPHVQPAHHLMAQVKPAAPYQFQHPP